MGQKNYEVCIIGGNNLVRSGLRFFLSGTAFSVIAEGATWAECAGTCDGPLAPDLLIVVLSPTVEGRGDAGELPILPMECAGDVPTVLVGTPPSLDMLLQSFRWGIDGCIPEDADAEVFITCCRAALLGQKVISSELFRALLSASRDSPARDEMHVEFSVREREILHCIVRGETNKMVARRLSVTESTVKVHMKRLIRKLGVRNRTQAAIWALSHGVEQNTKAA